MTMKLDFPNMAEVLSDPEKCETFSCKPREMKVKFRWVSLLDESSVSLGYFMVLADS